MTNRKKVAVGVAVLSGAVTLFLMRNKDELVDQVNEGTPFLKFFAGTAFIASVAFITCKR